MAEVRRGRVSSFYVLSLIICFSHLPSNDPITYLTLTASRPLSGRHAAVIPALPEDHESNIMYAPTTTPSNGTSHARDNTPPAPPIPTPPIANNGNGAPSHYYTEHGELVELDRPRELQIIHVDTEDLQSGTNHAHDGRVRHRSTHALSQGAPATMTSTIKPIMFHQEYPMAPPAQGQGSVQGPVPTAQDQHREKVSAGRERRNSRASNASYDEYSNGAGPERVHSPATSHRDRPPSRSPLLHREREPREQVFSPPHGHSPRQGSQQHSPYVSHNGRDRESDRDRGYASSPQSAVPATFASIMNAYPAPGGGAVAERERSRERDYEYARQEQGHSRSEVGGERDRRESPGWGRSN